MAAKYTLNVDPGAEHELSDAEVADLRAFGFEVTEVKSSGNTGRAATAKADEKKEG